MRKRISCKVIKSIPLGAPDNRLRQDFSASLHLPKINNVGTSTYTHRLVVTTTSIEEYPPAQLLDCRA
jgi:hypothetical protein